MPCSITERLIHQRLRNRLIEQLRALADGDTHLRRVGFVEYFEAFYDLVPHHKDGGFNPNSALSAAEAQAITRVGNLMDCACDETPTEMSEDAFSSTGWPTRIQTVAQHALALMLEKGPFSEDVNEDGPS